MFHPAQKPGAYLAGAGGICSEFASTDEHLAAKRRQLHAILLEFREYATWSIVGRSKDAVRWKWYDFKRKDRLPSPGHTGLCMGKGFVSDEVVPPSCDEQDSLSWDPGPVARLGADEVC